MVRYWQKYQVARRKNDGDGSGPGQSGMRPAGAIRFRIGAQIDDAGRDETRPDRPDDSDQRAVHASIVPKLEQRSARVSDPADESDRGSPLRSLLACCDSGVLRSGLSAGSETCAEL